MNLFEYADYKELTLDWVQSQPKQGRGLLSTFARVLGTNTVTISQIFRAERHLRPEQALKLSRFMGLRGLEEEYYLLLVELARSSTAEFTDYLEAKRLEIKNKAQDLQNRVPQPNQISEEDKGVYYSNWEYVAVRLKSALPEHSNAESIARDLNLPIEKAVEVLRFLIDKGFVDEEDGQLAPGILSTHLPSNSPYINNHRRNWRLQAMQNLSHANKNNLFYSGPMALSEEAIEKIRAKIVEFIAETTESIQDCPNEKTACLNIDWFSF